VEGLGVDKTVDVADRKLLAEPAEPHGARGQLLLLQVRAGARGVVVLGKDTYGRDGGGSDRALVVASAERVVSASRGGREKEGDRRQRRNATSHRNTPRCP